jgi:hypothetical protein
MRFAHPRLGASAASAYTTGCESARGRLGERRGRNGEICGSGRKLWALQAIPPWAAELNARKVPTARGKEWTHVQVGTVLAREVGKKGRATRRPR